MRFLLVLAFATVALAGTIVPKGHIELASGKVDKRVLELLDNSDTEYTIFDDEEQSGAEIQPMFIISWQVRRFIRKLQKQMPCGWPEYGIPPLAPLKISEYEFRYDNGFIQTFEKLFRFRIDGLDKFKIKKLKLNIITKKITFDFLFSNIHASATKYETETFVDAMRQLGLTVQYEGDGTLDFALKNLRVSGILRYKMPILWGSIKITSLQTTVALGSCESDITGVFGEGKLNRMLNAQIEGFIESGINDNQQAISDMIEANLVPEVNALLKGNNFWTILDYIFSSSEGESEGDPIVTNCVPPADPWA